MVLRLTVAAMAVGLGTGEDGSRAGQAAGGRSPPPSQAVAPDVLRGPAVSESVEVQTLVERDFMGRVRPLDATPEEAAVRLLPLDHAAQARVEAVLTERATVLDQMVVGNLDRLVEIHNAVQGGDWPTAFRLSVPLARQLVARFGRETLQERLSRVLPDDQRGEFVRLVDEYRRAWIEEAVAQAEARGERLSRLEAGVRLSLETLGQEISRAFQRTILAAAADFERLLTRLDLSPQQERQIRADVARFIEQTRGRASAGQRFVLFVRLVSILDREQRQILVRELGAGER